MLYYIPVQRRSHPYKQNSTNTTRINSAKQNQLSYTHTSADPIQIIPSHALPRLSTRVNVKNMPSKIPRPQRQLNRSNDPYRTADAVANHMRVYRSPYV